MLPSAVSRVKTAYDSYYYLGFMAAGVFCCRKRSVVR